MRLTKEEKDAMRKISKGADVYHYGIAQALRSVQKKNPALLTIGPAMEDRPEEEKQAYFGAILTVAGRKAVRS